jgi:hypothetical protein
MGGSLPLATLPGVRASLLALGLAAVLLGCGDDGGDEPKPEAKRTTAAAFIACFEKPGFDARRPKPREESVLAYQAKSSGFKVEPVNVTERGMLTPAAFLVFFESPERAAAAMKDLDAMAYGEVPPATRGAAVIGYGDKENRAAVGPAIDACIM